jgi:hypothetical protein
MERQQLSPKQAPQTTKTNIRVCTAQLSAQCQRRFERKGRRGKAPGYCPKCARAVRLRQSREWKSKKRQELGPAEYQRQYGAVYTISEEQRENWRVQKREQRARLRQQVEL